MSDADKELKDIKNNINIYLQQLDILKKFYLDKNILQERVYEKRSNGSLKYKDLLDMLRENENNAITNYNNLVNINFETDAQGQKTNKEFEKKKNLFNEEKSKSISLKNESSGTHILKENQYDINIVDNMYIIYYFLSYGIIGLFVYKILKQ
tara:strand:- start:7037 stop:7492 length:456 start_codon:yes stop_codon:yes gene_type:complete